MTRFYTVEELGPKRALTPEKFLICYDVPLARTGVQVYQADDIQLKGDGRGQVMVMRPREEVFRPESVDSANGKPVTLDHPPEGILLDPDNWKDYAVGHIQNPHQGEGILDDLLLADMIVKDRVAIDAILSGKKVEVSCGYDAQYEQDAPGHGRQKNIMINHMALVDRGRCGPRCAIHDSDPVEREDRRAVGRQPSAVEERNGRMAVTDSIGGRTRGGPFTRFLDRAKKAFSSDDQEEIERLKNEAEEEDRKTGDRRPADDQRKPADDRAPEEEGDRDVHVHLHRHAGDEDEIEERERQLAARDRTRDQGEGEGIDLAQLAQDVGEIKEILSDLTDVEEEEVGLMREEEENPEAETADRRRAAHDRRAVIRKRIRDWRRTRDENLEALPHDPESEGEQPYGAGPGPDKLKSGPPPKLGTGDGRRRTRDSAMPTRDSAALKDTWEHVVSQAEILSPGLRIATFDTAIPYGQTEQRICALRRRSLDAAYRTSEGQSAIDEVVGGDRVFNLRTATCDSLPPIFNAAVAVIANRNRRAAAGPGSMISVGPGGDKPMPAMVSDYNRRMRERFDKPIGR